MAGSADYVSPIPRYIARESTSKRPAGAASSPFDGHGCTVDGNGSFITHTHTHASLDALSIEGGDNLSFKVEYRNADSGIDK